MISVCMATYNGQRFILEQIESILNQLSDDDELIISDDSSVDDTLNIIQSIGDSRIVLLSHNKPSDLKFKFSYTTANLYNALLYAKGDYVFLADQDDVWLPNKVELMLPYLSDYELVLADCHDVDSNLNLLNASHFELENASSSFLKNMYKSSFLGANMCMTNAFLRKVLPLPSNIPHDLWFGCIASINGTLFLLDEITMLYRRHDGNVSSTNNKLLDKQNGNAILLNKNSNSLYFKLRIRFVFLRKLFLYFFKKMLCIVI